MSSCSYLDAKYCSNTVVPYISFVEGIILDSAMTLRKAMAAMQWMRPPFFVEKVRFRGSFSRHFFSEWKGNIF